MYDHELLVIIKNDRYSYDLQIIVMINCLSKPIGNGDCDLIVKSKFRENSMNRRAKCNPCFRFKSVWNDDRKLFDYFEQDL